MVSKNFTIPEIVNITGARRRDVVRALRNRTLRGQSMQDICEWSAAIELRNQNKRRRHNEARPQREPRAERTHGKFKATYTRKDWSDWLAGSLPANIHGKGA